MKQKFITLLLLFIIGMSHAQRTSSERALNRFLEGNTNRHLYNFIELYKDVEGHPYLYDEVTTGDIKLINNQVIKNIQFKLNIYENVIEYSKDGQLINIVAKQVKGFTLKTPDGKQIREFRNGFKGDMGKTNQYTFFETFYVGQKVSVLQYIYKNLLKANYQIQFDVGNKTDKFGKIHKRVYVIKDGQAQKVKLSKKSILKLFSDQKKKIKQFIEDNKLKCNIVEDLTKVARYYELLFRP